VKTAAYQVHLKTPHFQKYKTSTLHMVKSLSLAHTELLDWEAAELMFGKLED